MNQRIKYGTLYIDKDGNTTLEDIEKKYPDWTLIDENDNCWVITRYDGTPIRDIKGEHNKNLMILLLTFHRLLGYACEPYENYNRFGDIYRQERYLKRLCPDMSSLEINKEAEKMVDERDDEDRKMNYDNINGMLDMGGDMWREIVEDIPACYATPKE